MRATLAAALSLFCIVSAHPALADGRVVYVASQLSQGQGVFVGRAEFTRQRELVNDVPDRGSPDRERMLLHGAFVASYPREKLRFNFDALSKIGGLLENGRTYVIVLAAACIAPS